LKEQGVDPNSIDKIIFIKSRQPDHLISSEAARLKHDLKAEKALTYSISDLGCADISMALKLAKDYLIANRRANNVLIAYGHKQFAKYRFRFPVTIAGDGGVAVLVGKTEENKIVDIAIDTNGYYWDLFKIDYKEKHAAEYIEECSDQRKYGFELAIESKNRFKALNEKILAANNVDASAVSHYLLQNISNRAYEYYENAYGIKISNLCSMNLSQYGHLGPADVMLNYHLGVSNGMFQKGSTVLIMNNSPVAAWSSILMTV
jgi:3-oxoacyl-[acyl-carrier-protein] synthase III